MILIADSGSTKTDWKFVVKGNVQESFETIGFNPYIISSNEVLKVLETSNLMEIKNVVEEVYLYAAGCATEANRAILKQPLQDFFLKAKVTVNHDLLAAARATCGSEKGMVAILGTGSNSCLYDGNEIIENIASLGYVLGDYGGGVDIGKNFISKLLGRELSKEIENEFQKEYNLSLAAILDAVYKKPLPNRYLAGFSKFVHQHINKDELRNIVKNCLISFFDTNICKYTNYKNYKLHTVGSVGLVYKDLIEEVAADYGVELGVVIKTPIDELVNYHLA